MNNIPESDDGQQGWPADSAADSLLWWAASPEQREHLRQAFAVTFEVEQQAKPWWEGGSSVDQHTPDWYRHVRRELLALSEHSPAQLRRIAELTALLVDESSALPWWQKAAQAGDDDARDMLSLLLEERYEQPPHHREEPT